MRTKKAVTTKRWSLNLNLSFSFPWYLISINSLKLKVFKETEHSQLSFSFASPLHLLIPETHTHTIFDYRSNGLSKDSEELDVSRQSVWSIDCRCCFIPLNLQESQGHVVHCSVCLSPFTEVSHLRWGVMLGHPM